MDKKANPPYDRETFELMMWDYCCDNADSDWDGEWPEIFAETIEFDGNNWVANCKFPSDKNVYTFVGYDDGNVRLLY